MSHHYADLHAHSAYSFLDGANEPADLVRAAAHLGGRLNPDRPRRPARHRQARPGWPRTGSPRGPLRRALGDPNRPTTWDLPAADRCLGQLVDLLGPVTWQ
nr:hypothetical protein [Actinomyces trachealis]